MNNEILGYECMTKGCGVVTQHLLDKCPMCQKKDWRAIVARDKLDIIENPSPAEMLSELGYIKPEYCFEVELRITKDKVKKKDFKIRLSESSMQGDKTGFVHRVRVIDKENDRYIEKVGYLDTGTIIRDCDEKLSEHYGHGSDKNK